MNKEEFILFFERMYTDNDESGLDVAFGFLFCSLLNSDNFSIEDFDNAILKMEELKDALISANVSEDFREEYIKKIDGGLHILKRDLDLRKDRR